jgi:hypothetical protein
MSGDAYPEVAFAARKAIPPSSSEASKRTAPFAVALVGADYH